VATQTPDAPEQPESEGLLDFLSPDWLAALQTSLTEVHGTSEQGGGNGPELAGTPLAVGQIVTDVPFLGGGELRYTVSLAGGGPRVSVGSVQSADVVLVTSYAAAAALAAGERTAGSLLAAGDIKLKGDVARLVAVVGLVERAAGATRSLQERTRYR